MSECFHEDFAASCRVDRLEDSGRFMLAVEVRCSRCQKPFQFLGLKPGLDMDGARVSLDGLEMSVGITPQGVVPSPLQGFLRGYDVNLGKTGRNQ